MLNLTYHLKPGLPGFFCFMAVLKHLAVLFLLLFHNQLAAETSEDGKIAATVNGVEIKYSQIAGAPNVAQKISLLETLVREEALYQKAVELNFNTDPEYLKLLKEEKEKLLIDAYFAIETAAMPQPTESEIDTFIANNPHLFEGRKTWHYSKIQINRNESVGFSDLQNAVKLSKNLNNVTEWLRKLGIDFEIDTQWLGSEQIEVAEYQALSAMDVGQVKIIPYDKKFVLLQIHQFYEDPRKSEDYRMAVSRGLSIDAKDIKISQIKKSIMANADYEILVPNDIKQVNKLNDVARIGDKFIKAEDFDGQVTRESVISEIERRLILQQVFNMSLDTNPMIVTGLNNLERRLLISKFIDNQVSSLAPPEFQKLSNFVKGNQQFFSQRYVYNFSILILNKEAKKRIPEFAEVFLNKSFFEIQSWLKAEQLLIGTNTLWRGTEKLSIELLKTLPKMKSGEWLLLQEEGANSVRVLYKHSAHKDPIQNQAAIDLARKILTDIDKTRAGRQMVERVRTKAKVELAPELEAMIPPEKAARNNIISLPLSAQVMLLISIFLAIIWLWLRSKAIDSHSKRKPSTKIQKIIRLSNKSPFLLFISIIGLTATMLPAYYLWWSDLDIQFTDRALVSSSAVGFSLACLFGFALLWINSKRQMLANGMSMLLLNRWWPLVLVISGQVFIFILVLLNR